MAALSQHSPVGHTRSLLAQTWGQDLLELTSPFHAVQHLPPLSASRGASVTLSCDIFILSGFYLFLLIQEALTHWDVVVIRSFWAWCQFYLHIHEKWQEMGTWLALQDQKVQLCMEMSMQVPKRASERVLCAARHGELRRGPHVRGCAGLEQILAREVLPTDFHSDPFHFSVSHFLALLDWLPSLACVGPVKSQTYW